MVVLCEKDVVPPPPYEHPTTSEASNRTSSAQSRNASITDLAGSSSAASCSGSGTSNRRRQSGHVVAPTLPSHIQLLIVYATLPRTGELVNTLVDGRRVKIRENAEATAIRTTRTLYWVAFYLRCVNRGLYLGELKGRQCN